MPTTQISQIAQISPVSQLAPLDIPVQLSVVLPSASINKVEIQMKHTAQLLVEAAMEVMQETAVHAQIPLLEHAHNVSLVFLHSSTEAVCLLAHLEPTMLLNIVNPAILPVLHAVQQDQPAV